MSRFTRKIYILKNSSSDEDIKANDDERCERMKLEVLQRISQEFSTLKHDLKHELKNIQQDCRKFAVFKITDSFIDGILLAASLFAYVCGIFTLIVALRLYQSQNKVLLPKKSQITQ